MKKTLVKKPALTHIVGFRCTNAEKALLNKAALAAGRTVAAEIRWQLFLKK